MPVTPVSSFDGLPLVLNLNEIVAIFRRGKSTILRDLKAGTFRPEPYESDPYHWFRDEVRKYFDRMQHADAARKAETTRRTVRSRRGNRRPSGKHATL